jgi:hypothetical protein
MPTLAELKASSPAYAQMSDMEFASKVYRKHYADKMDFPTFAKKAALDPYGDANGVDPTDPDARVNAGAAMGKAFVDLGHGIRNAATDAARYAVDSNNKIFGEHAADGLKARVAQQQAEKDATDKRDAPLMATKAGKAGYVAGVAAETLLPGAGLRGTSLGRALMPTTARGLMAQGAAYGAVQPVGTQDSRALNTGLGGLAGLVGAGIPMGGGALGRLVAKPFRAFTKSGEDEAVASILRGSATDPSALMAPQPSSIQGVKRTLAEESRDPGTAMLERAIRAKSNGEFDVMRRNNNAARNKALESFAGDDAAMRAAEHTRTAVTNGLRDAAFREGDETAYAARRAGFSPAQNVAGLKNRIESLSQSFGGRSAIQKALGDVMNELDGAEPSARGLYNVRKSINDLIEGKAGNEKSYAKAATKQLMQARNMVDEEIKSLAPSFGDYLESYQTLSKPINRMQLGRTLLDRGTGATEDAHTGAYTIMPGAFNRQAKNLDAAAAKATGFKKAKAADILQPQDFSAISGIKDDLSRQVFADSAERNGSDTFQKFMKQGQALEAMKAIGVNVPGGSILKLLGKKGEERINKALAAALANPQQARAILQSVPPAERRIIQQMMTEAGGRLGVVAPTITKQFMPQSPSGQ